MNQKEDKKNQSTLKQSKEASSKKPTQAKKVELKQASPKKTTQKTTQAKKVEANQSSSKKLKQIKKVEATQSSSKKTTQIKKVELKQDSPKKTTQVKKAEATQSSSKKLKQIKKVEANKSSTQKPKQAKKVEANQSSLKQAQKIEQTFLYLVNKLVLLVSLLKQLFVLLQKLFLSLRKNLKGKKKIILTVLASITLLMVLYFSVIFIQNKRYILSFPHIFSSWHAKAFCSCYFLQENTVDFCHNYAKHFIPIQKRTIDLVRKQITVKALLIENSAQFINKKYGCTLIPYHPHKKRNKN